MDNKALYSLSYGVFILGTKDGERLNACVTNTCMQVASNPTRIAISCLNQNLTCEMIKNSGFFSLSILDDTANFFTIKHFGFQSGRDVDKFSSMAPKLDKNGVPYIFWQTCAVLSAKVISQTDLGSHTLFLAEVTDCEVLSKNPPLTYADYHAKVKPKQRVDKSKKIIGYRCKICGYILNSDNLPADFVCPLCSHDASDFEPIYEE